MSPTGTRGSVVVGIDGTRGAEAALDWATAEAAARGCRLRIVHAFHPSLLVDPYGVAPPLGDFPLVWAGAEQVLAQAVARVRSVAPDLPVTTRLLLDSPQASDPHLQALLDDLELVLAQIVRLPRRVAAPDVYLIDQTVDQREVLPRLREMLAENPTSQP